MTQHRLAELIGVTSQQAYKYEKCVNRVTGGRLYWIAQALGVEVSYFFEGLESAGGFMSSPQQRMLLDLVRDYLKIPVREHREAIVALARALAEGENRDGRAPKARGSSNCRPTART